MCAGPDGNGVYIATNAPAHAPPAHGWQPLSEKKGEANAVPMVRTFREVTQENPKGKRDKNPLHMGLD